MSSLAGSFKTVAERRRRAPAWQKGSSRVVQPNGRALGLEHLFARVDDQSRLPAADRDRSLFDVAPMGVSIIIRGNLLQDHLLTLSRAH